MSFMDGWANISGDLVAGSLRTDLSMDLGVRLHSICIPPAHSPFSSTSNITPHNFFHLIYGVGLSHKPARYGFWWNQKFLFEKSNYSIHKSIKLNFKHIHTFVIFLNSNKYIKIFGFALNIYKKKKIQKRK